MKLTPGGQVKVLDFGLAKALDPDSAAGGAPGISASQSPTITAHMTRAGVILGTAAIENPDLVKDLASRYPGKVIVGIDARDGKVATRGWIEESTVEATDLASELSACGIAAIISTDIATDGTLAGPNLEALRAMAEASSVPVIASGGIGCMADLLALLALEARGVTGVIVGRALYDGRVDLSEAIDAMGSGRLQDAFTTSGGLA